MTLRELLRFNLQSVRAHLLEEEFQQFWEYESPAWAAKFLDEWCSRVMRSRIDPLKKLAGTVRAHRELLLNYFRARKQFSSGIVEGLNNKDKVTMRKVLRLANVPRHRTLSVPRARPPPGAATRPPILLTNRRYSAPARLTFRRSRRRYGVNFRVRLQADRNAGERPRV